MSWRSHARSRSTSRRSSRTARTWWERSRRCGTTTGRPARTSFRRPTRTRGVLLWAVDVVDADPEATKSNRTMTVKVSAKVQPVLEKLEGELPFRQVEFVGHDGDGVHRGERQLLAGGVVAAGQGGVLAGGQAAPGRRQGGCLMSGARWDEEWGWLGPGGPRRRACAAAPTFSGRPRTCPGCWCRLPKEPGGLVPVTVVVPDERAVKRAKRELLARSEYLVDFIGEISGTGWSAETGGLRDHRRARSAGVRPGVGAWPDEHRRDHARVVPVPGRPLR